MQAMLLFGLLVLSPASPSFTFQDGPRAVQAERQPGWVHSPAWGALRAVDLRYPGHALPVRVHVGPRAVVQLPDGQDERVFSSLGLRAVRPLMPSRRLWLVESQDGRDGLETAQRLVPHLRAGTLTLAEPDLYVRHTLHSMPIPPNDPRYGGQWYLQRIGVESAWALGTGSADVTVVVIDNGCDMQHPDLAAKMDPGKDVVSGDDDPSFEPDRSGNLHGTACAGLVGAVTNNGVGIAGACPDCRLRCVRLLTDDPAGTPMSADVDAFQFALETGAAVVSNSWGFVEAIPVPASLAEAIENVFDNGRGGKGAMVLFASGNDDRVVNDNELLAVRGVIGVGAINVYDETTQFTNFGNSVDIVAPTGTLSTDIHGADGDSATDYTSTFGGTSSACPVAAGVAGLLAAAAPDKTAAELSEILIHSARPSPYAQPDAQGHDPYYGFGVVDPAHALRTALGLPEPSDGGHADAAVVVDAGAVDAGSVVDHKDDGDSGDSKPGCLCQAPAAGVPWALLGMLALVARRRR